MCEELEEHGDRGREQLRIRERAEEHPEHRVAEHQSARRHSGRRKGKDVRCKRSLSGQLRQMVERRYAGGRLSRIHDLSAPNAFVFAPCVALTVE